MEGEREGGGEGRGGEERGGEGRGGEGGEENSVIYLKGLVDELGAVFVGFLGRELCIFELQKLTPQDLKKNSIWET